MPFLGLDREVELDLGSIPDPPNSHVFLLGRNQSDFGITYQDGSDIKYLDSSLSETTFAIPGGATVFYIGGGIWKLGGSLLGVIEPTGISSLVGSSGNLPIGNGGEWAIDSQSGGSNSDTRVNTTLMATVGFILPAGQTGGPVDTTQQVPSTAQPVGQVINNSNLTDDTANLLFAGFNCSIFDTSSATVTDNSTSDFLFFFAVFELQCAPLWGFINTVTMAEGALSPLGTMFCNQVAIHRFVDRDITRTFTKPRVAYNALTDSMISTSSHRALSFSPAEIPALGNNTIAVNLNFEGSHITTGFYDSRLNPMYSQGCRTSTTNYGSMPPGLSGWVHPDLPDNDSDPNNINHFQTTFFSGCEILLTNIGNTSETTQTWNYSPHPDWQGFIGSRIKWCVPNSVDPSLIDRYSGTITATNPAAQTAGQISETQSGSERPSIENDIPGAVTVTELTVNLTSVETVAFDWHFSQGFTFYHEDSLSTIPNDPDTCQMIAKNDGTISIIASDTAPTINEVTQGTNKFEKWEITAAGNISLVGTSEYNIHGMGSPDLDNTLAWDIGLI